MTGTRYNSQFCAFLSILFLFMYGFITSLCYSEEIIESVQEHVGNELLDIRKDITIETSNIIKENNLLTKAEILLEVEKKHYIEMTELFKYYIPSTVFIFVAIGSFFYYYAIPNIAKKEIDTIYASHKSDLERIKEETEIRLGAEISKIQSRQEEFLIEIKDFRLVAGAAITDFTFLKDLFKHIWIGLKENNKGQVDTQINQIIDDTFDRYLLMAEANKYKLIYALARSYDEKSEVLMKIEVVISKELAQHINPFLFVVSNNETEDKRLRERAFEISRKYSTV